MCDTALLVDCLGLLRLGSNGKETAVIGIYLLLLEYLSCLRICYQLFSLEELEIEMLFCYCSTGF